MKYRKIEIYKDNHWQEIDFHNLKTGDKFRMFEPSGEPVVGNKNDIEFVATSDTFWDEKLQQYAIDIY